MRYARSGFRREGLFDAMPRPALPATLLPCALVLALLGPSAAQDAAREAARAAELYAPSVWDLPLGAHASALRASEFINYACGTDGGPPSQPIGGWSDWAKCKPEPATGLFEVYFEYDDEPEFVARARDLATQAALYAGTTIYGLPVVASALFDSNGFFVRLRIVSDARAPVEKRELGASLSGYLAVRFGDALWACASLPARAGETEYRGSYLRRLCRQEEAAGLTTAAAEDRATLTLETHSYRKPGQSAIDPLTRRATTGAFESSTRFEAFLALGIPDAARRLAELVPAAEAASDVRELLACPSCDHAGKNLKRADLRGADLAGARLAGANLHAAQLAGANLRGADLSRANLNRADLRKAALTGARMPDAMLYAARADGADLTDADLSGVLAGEVQLIGATLRQARLVDADLRRARLGGADLTQADLSGSWLMDALLARASLRGARLLRTVLWAAVLTDADLSGAIARDADFSRASLRAANLRAADLSGARLDTANLADARLDGTNLTGAELPAGFTPP